MSQRDDDLEHEDETGELEQNFPLGDGTADTETTVTCPYCGELNEIALDPGSGPEQEYVEDCGVCCQPWRVIVTYAEDGSAIASVEAQE